METNYVRYSQPFCLYLIVKTKVLHSVIEGLESWAPPAYSKANSVLFSESTLLFGDDKDFLFRHVRGGQTCSESGGTLTLQLCGYRLHIDFASNSGKSNHNTLNPFPVYFRWKTGQMYEDKEQSLTEQVYTVSEYLNR